ncbi:MAG: PAS domain S-box protein, partial [Oxalobacteraceae bacterium]
MLRFMAGETELAERIRTYAWDKTDLGDPSGWPEALKTLVSVVLGANQPMFIVWGPSRRLLYNDRYTSVLQGHHPEALGRPFLKVWSEIADSLEPLVEDAYAGIPSHNDDIMLMMERNGYPEETHFAYSYTPVRVETGDVGGFFCACIETTSQVMTERAVRESEVRNRQILNSAIDYAIVATDREGLVTQWNSGAERILGWTEAEMCGQPVDRFFTPEDQAGNRPQVEM